MKKKILRRPVADKTRSRIIKAAQKLFATAGFSGTTTQAIAKAAKVNETLIFHHFGNKSQLWQQVKATLVENLSIESVPEEPESLRSFLELIINQRIHTYQQHPDLIRLLQWQRLEANQDKLIAGNNLAPTNWLTSIQYLQKNGKIRTDIHAEIIMLWITASINPLLTNETTFFRDENNKKDYVKFLLTSLEQVLTADTKI